MDSPEVRQITKFTYIDRHLTPHIETDHMKTWNNIESVDDLFTKEEKEIIEKIEVELSRGFPHLRKKGEYFYYCSGGISEDSDLSLGNWYLLFEVKQELAQLQLHCMDRYEACCHYNGSLPFPGSSSSSLIR